VVATVELVTVVAVAVQFAHTLLNVTFQTHKAVTRKYKTGQDLNKR
jgi:hypothetical protein